MKIQDLPEPYKSLALLRRYQNIEVERDDSVVGAFAWEETPEGHSWWAGVNKGELPEVPKASLEELKYYSGFAWEDVIREAVKDVKSRRKSIYIAGPMRGIPFFNFDAFDAAHDKLEDEGWNVISPADLDREHGFDALDMEPDSDWNDLSKVPFSIEECFDRDIEAIKKADAIYMLKGWQNSTGAQAEYWCAKWRHKDIYFQEEPQAAIFPVDAQKRKEYPVGTFIKDYFPNAIAALAHHSYVSQAQHGPTTNGAPMEWLKDKSVGDGNQIIRHYMEGDYENMAWRALELLERELTNNRQGDK